jgi:hypothetical protein
MLRTQEAFQVYDLNALPKRQSQNSDKNPNQRPAITTLCLVQGTKSTHRQPFQMLVIIGLQLWTHDSQRRSVKPRVKHKAQHAENRSPAQKTRRKWSALAAITRVRLRV